MAQEELFELFRVMTSSEYDFVMPTDCEETGEFVDDQWSHTWILQHRIVFIHNKPVLLAIIIVFSQQIYLAWKNPFDFDTAAICLFQQLIFQAIV